MNPTEDRASHPAVPASAYTSDYFLGQVEGHDDFVASGGRHVGARFAWALRLAALRPGERALDVGCGRGEVVVQAALAGAHAVGIDYAPAALQLSAQAARSLEAEGGRTGLALASGLRLPFRPAAFDAVFLLDVVEHLLLDELAETLAEIVRVLRPGGRIVVHTSPNRLFEDVVYPRYVRRVHQLALALSNRVGLHDGVFNKIMLPTSPEFPEADYDRLVHVTPHSPGSLSRALTAAGLRVRRVAFWEPPSKPFYGSRRLNLEVRLLDAVRYFKPLSDYPPLNRLFKNHIWILAERP